MVLESKIEQILPDAKDLVDCGVTFLGLINKNGRVTDCVDNGINMKRSKREMFFMSHRLVHSMNADFDEEFGPVEYSITERQNQKFVTMPTPFGTLLAVIPKDKSHAAFIDKLKKAPISSSSQ